MKIDVAGHIGAVSRAVRNLERDGRPAKAIVAARAFDTAVDDVWDAISNPERIPRWFLPVSGDFRPGGRYQLEGNASGEITRCEPPRLLAVTWEFAGNVSWLEVRLTAESPARTVLELEHVAHEDAHWEQFGAGAGGIGWDMGLMGLAEHLTGAPRVEPAAAMAWMTSEEGKDFMRRSGAGWQRAAVAGGAAEAEAAAQAERTLAAYTGEAAEA